MAGMSLLVGEHDPWREISWYPANSRTAEFGLVNIATGLVPVMLQKEFPIFMVWYDIVLEMNLLYIVTLISREHAPESGNMIVLRSGDALDHSSARAFLASTGEHLSNLEKTRT